MSASAAVLPMPTTHPVAVLSLEAVRLIRPLVSQAANETIAQIDAIAAIEDRAVLETRLRKLERVEKEICAIISKICH